MSVYTITAIFSKELATLIRFIFIKTVFDQDLHEAGFHCVELYFHIHV
jgi:hypothetical protein